MSARASGSPWREELGDRPEIAGYRPEITGDRPEIASEIGGGPSCSMQSRPTWEIRGDTGRYGEMWGDVGRCGEIWGDVGRYEEMWGDIGPPARIAHPPAARLVRGRVSLRVRVRVRVRVRARARG